MFTGDLGFRGSPVVRLGMAVVTRAIFGAVVVRLIRASYARSAASRSGGCSGVDLLVYTVVASLVLFAVACGPALLLPEGAWFLLAPPGFAFFSCAILLALTVVHSLPGLSKRFRERLHPEYPTLRATLLFALGVVAFVAYHAFGL